MWAIWLIPLFGLSYLALAVVAAALFVGWPPKRRGQWVTLVVLMFASPIVLLLAVSAIQAFLHKSDRQLFEEIWGFQPDMVEQQMLSDDFGMWSDRAIYLRTSPEARDRQRMLSAMHGPAGITSAQFAAYGESRQFSWWHTQCEAPRILEADGYRGWKMLRILDCRERRELYIVALRP